MLIRTLLTLSLGAALLLALACDDGAASVDAPCTNEATAEAYATRSATFDGRLELGDVPRDELHCRLNRAVIRADDLPGWEESRPPRRASGGEIGCGVWLPFSGQPGVAALFVAPTTDEEENPTLAAQRVLYVPDGMGALVLASLRRACDRTEIQDGELAIDYTHEELDLAKDIHGILTNEIRDPGTNFGSASRRIVFASGNVLVETEVIGDPSPDAAIARRLAGVSADRIKQVGPLPAPEPVESSGCATPGEVPPPDASLRAGLLRLGDLPRTYLEAPNRPCDYSGPSPWCDEREPRGAALTPVAVERVQFTGGLAAEAFVLHVIATYAPGEAMNLAQGLATRATMSASCVSAFDGYTVTTTYGPLNSGGLDDRFVTWRARLTYRRGDDPAGDGSVFRVLDLTEITEQRGNRISHVTIHDLSNKLDMEEIVIAASARFAALGE